MSTHHYVQSQLVAYIVCEPVQYNTTIQWQQLARNERRFMHCEIHIILPT